MDDRLHEMLPARGRHQTVRVEERIAAQADHEFRQAHPEPARPQARDGGDDRVAGVVAQVLRRADVARHVEAAGVRAEIREIEAAARRERVLREVGHTHDDLWRGHGPGLHRHVVEVRRRRGVVAVQAPDPAEFVDAEFDLDPAPSRLEQIAEELLVTHVIGGTEAEIAALAPRRRRQRGGIRGGRRAHAPAVDHAGGLSGQQVVAPDIEGDQRLVAPGGPGQSRRHDPVVEPPVLAEHPAVRVQDVPAGPVAPLHARRAAGAGDHLAVVHETDLP